MAVDDVADLDQEDLEQTVKKSGRKRKIIIVAVVALLLIGGATGGAFYYLNRQKPAEKGQQAKAVPKDSYYLALDPAFVVNFQSDGSRARFLQITLDAVTHQQQMLDEIKKHMPVIRNNLVMLFSSQKYKDLITSAGKERLRAEALRAIQKVMKQQTGKTVVDNVYFTSFVMQ